MSVEEPATPPPLQPETHHRPGSVDPKVLDTIRSLQQPGNPDLLQRVIRIYLEDSLRLLQELREARTQGDEARMKRQAHTLKSSSANVGALRLSSLCKELETVAPEHTLVRVQELISQIESEYQIVQTELNQELQTVQAG